MKNFRRLDHGHYYLFNSDTEEYAVMCRLNDGGYGLIEPETSELEWRTSQWSAPITEEMAHQRWACIPT